MTSWKRQPERWWQEQPLSFHGLSADINLSRHLQVSLGAFSERRTFYQSMRLATVMSFKLTYPFPSHEPVSVSSLPSVAGATPSESSGWLPFSVLHCDLHHRKCCSLKGSISPLGVGS